MVRLEKLAWEQAVNVKALGRNRNIASPRKWWTQSKQLTFQVASQQAQSGVTGYVLRALEPIYAFMTYQWNRDIAISKGLALDDYETFKDRYLRREYLFEMVNRQSCHPFTREHWRHRRARVYKCERAFRGFLAPDWLQNEARQKLGVDTFINRRKWDNFMHHNYFSELTPSVRISAVPRLHISELISIFNIFNNKAWDRMFFNEQGYIDYTMQEVKDNSNPFAKFDLQTEAGRKDFEAEVNRFIKLYPNMIVLEGEQFDFEAYYIKDAIENQRDLTKFDQKKVESIKQLQLEFNQELDDENNPLPQAVDPVQAQIKVGSVMPKWVQQTRSKSLV